MAEPVEPNLAPSAPRGTPPWFGPVVVAAVGAVFVVGIVLAFVIPSLRDADRRERTRSSVQTIEEEPLREEPTPTAEVSSTDPYLTRVFIEDALERNAVCNDGSSAVYFYRPGEAEGADKWVIWFEGGGGCFDAASCQMRWEAERHLMTTNTTGERSVKDGISSSDSGKNPDFHKWNHVILNYCSSDRWIGDNVTLDIEAGPIVFNGANIVEAVFEDLQNSAIVSPTIDDATAILVTGSSAGGRGVGQNLDRIAGWFPNIDVRGVIDSSFKLDTEPFAVVYAYEEKDNLPGSGSVFLDETCVAAHPDDTTACVPQENLYPYLETPVFTYLALTDQALMRGFGIEDEKDGAQDAWLDAYVAELIPVLETFDGVFAPDISAHTAIQSERFTAPLIDGYSFADILGNWYFDREGLTEVIAEHR